MLERLSRSLLPVQALLSGFAYMLGIIFVLISLRKFQIIGNARARSSSGVSMFVPTVYLLGGAALIFLPSTLQVITASVFGADSAISYAPLTPFDFDAAFRIMIKTAGILWFIRGTTLIVQASSPGVQHGPKGMAFLVAGIVAMNFEMTVSIINSMLIWLAGTTLTARQNMGY